jgi:hypothetical protein
MPRNEVETAYFTLLRAREEVAQLRRYDDFLRAEARRLRRTSAEARALADQVDRRFLRTIRHTDQPLEDAVNERLAVIADELERVPDRLEAAEAYVAECERHHAELRGGG